MNGSASPGLQTVFRSIVARRFWIVALYALLVPLAIDQALRVQSDNSIARLIVESDPDFRNNREFQRLFPEGEQAILLVEAADPFAPGTLERVDSIERRIDAIPRVSAFSALALHDRVRPGSRGSAGWADDFRRFATGTDLFRKQGLVGDDFLGIALDLEVEGARRRDEILRAIDGALLPFESGSPAPGRIRRIGGPYVDSYLEGETARASLRYFPLFGLFIVGMNLVLYRSARTLAAFLLTLAVSVALTVGAGRSFGFVFTIVSSLVPLTILVTCTAPLAYIQSRFAQCPEGTPVDQHQVVALADKVVATTP